MFERQKRQKPCTEDSKLEAPDVNFDPTLDS